MVRPSQAGAAVTALFQAIMVVLDSSSMVMHLRLCHTLRKGKDIVTCSGLRNIPPNVVHALTALMYSKANRKYDIEVQKNNLNEEEEQQQDHVLAARIDRQVLIFY